MLVAVVTGASDGIGKETAMLLAGMGHKVYGISRSGSGFDFMEHIPADVSDRDGVEKALELVYEKEGTIDILVCSAGTSLASAAEMTDIQDARYLFDVNYWGYVYVASYVLRRMKADGTAGRVALVSSMTGILPLPFLSYYGSSKAAIINYACAAANEAKPFGISLSVVMPGGVRTRFTDRRKKYRENEYSPGLEKAIAVLSREEQTGLYPEQVANKIIKLLNRKNPSVIVPVGGIYRFYCILQRILPVRLILFVIRKKYSV